MRQFQCVPTTYVFSINEFFNISSVRVYAVIKSKYATKIVGTQKGQVACVNGTQGQKQTTFNTFKPAK